MHKKAEAFFDAKIYIFYPYIINNSIYVIMSTLVY